MSEESILKRHQQVLYDKKWKKFLRRTWVFRHIPFVDFVLGAGSLAIGNVRPTSDFDVIVAARTARIFTVRLFLILALDLFGRRRKNLDHGIAAADTVCLNHFVTVKSFELSPPYNDYWRAMYKNLVPVFGKTEVINQFLSANHSWLDASTDYQDDMRHFRKKNSLIKISLEKLLRGKFGDGLENLFKNIQLKKIAGNPRPQVISEPRLTYTDEEIEFHPVGTKKLEGF